MRLQLVLSLQAAALPATKDLATDWIQLTSIMPKSKIYRGTGQ